MQLSCLEGVNNSARIQMAEVRECGRKRTLHDASPPGDAFLPPPHFHGSNFQHWRSLSLEESDFAAESRIIDWKLKQNVIFVVVVVVAAAAARRDGRSRPLSPTQKKQLIRNHSKPFLNVYLHPLKTLDRLTLKLKKNQTNKKKGFISKFSCR